VNGFCSQSKCGCSCANMTARERLSHRKLFDWLPAEEAMTDTLGERGFRRERNAASRREFAGVTFEVLFPRCQCSVWRSRLSTMNGLNLSG
jgi:hypothetical protein